MNRRFILPAAFALALLSELFFGFSKAPVSEAAASGPTLTEIDFPRPSADLDPTREASEKTRTAAAWPALPPELPDYADILKPVDFPMPPQADLSPAPKGPPVLDAQLFQPAGLDDGSGWGTTDHTLEAALLDNSPRARVQPPPVYPAAARMAGIDGEVVVEFMVDRTGRVVRPRVVRSSDRLFDEPTLRAVSEWRFEPGRKDGRTVSFRMIVPVVFRAVD
jgi:protein TonB